MAEHMKEIFGELLYNTPRNPERGALPSPEELRNKILVKVLHKYFRSLLVYFAQLSLFF